MGEILKVEKLRTDILIIGAGAAGSVGAEMSSKLAEGVIQLVMSTEATAGTMVEKLENNVDPTEAALYARSCRAETVLSVPRSQTSISWSWLPQPSIR